MGPIINAVDSKEGRYLNNLCLSPAIHLVAVVRNERSWLRHRKAPWGCLWAKNSQGQTQRKEGSRAACVYHCYTPSGCSQGWLSWLRHNCKARWGHPSPSWPPDSEKGRYWSSLCLVYGLCRNLQLLINIRRTVYFFLLLCPPPPPWLKSCRPPWVGRVHVNIDMITNKANVYFLFYFFYFSYSFFLFQDGRHNYWNIASNINMK